jgi:hypothetical protein
MWRKTINNFGVLPMQATTEQKKTNQKREESLSGE